MDEARLIIVCGLPGAGKTVHAKQLAVEVDGVRLSADEWMEALGVNLWDESLRARVEALQWELAQTLLRLGQTVIVEWGTWGRAEREALRTGARALGAAIELHHLDPPLDVHYRRVRKRSAEEPPIEFADLERWSDRFQRPSPDERAGYDSVMVVR